MDTTISCHINSGEVPRADHFPSVIEGCRSLSLGTNRVGETTFHFQNDRQALAFARCFRDACEALILAVEEKIQDREDHEESAAMYQSERCDRQQGQ